MPPAPIERPRKGWALCRCGFLMTTCSTQTNTLMHMIHDHCEAFPEHGIAAVEEYALNWLRGKALREQIAPRPVT